jgi:peptidoglycan hydrolase CwlO-like protein
LCASLLSTAIYGANDQAQAIVDDLARRSKALREVVRDERLATVALSDVDEALVRTHRALDQLTREVALREQSIAGLRSKIAVDVRSLDELKLRVRARLRTLPHTGGLGYVGAMLSTRSLNDLALRRALLSRIAAHDAATLGALKNGRAQLLQDRFELELQLEQLKKQQAAHAATLAALEKTRTERGEAGRHRSPHRNPAPNPKKIAAKSHPALVTG